MATVVPGGVTGPTRGQMQMQMQQLLQQGVQAGMQLAEQKREWDDEQQRLKREFNINKAYDFMTKAGSEHPAGLAGWIGENQKTFSYILEGIGMNPVDVETTYLAIKNQAMTPEQFLSAATAHKLEISEGNTSGIMKEVKGSISSKTALDRMKATTPEAPVPEGTMSTSTNETPRVTEDTVPIAEQPRDGWSQAEYKQTVDTAATPVPKRSYGETRNLDQSSFQGPGTPSKQVPLTPREEYSAPSPKAPIGGTPAGNMTMRDAEGKEHRGYRTNLDGKTYFLEPATGLYYEFDSQGVISNPLAKADILLSKDFGLITPKQQRELGSMSEGMGLEGITAMVASDTPMDVSEAAESDTVAVVVSNVLKGEVNDADLEKAASKIRMTRKGSGAPQTAVIKKNIKGLGEGSTMIAEGIASGDKGTLNEGIGKYVYSFDKLLSYSDFKELSSTDAGRRMLNKQMDSILNDPEKLKALTLYMEGPTALANLNSAEALMNDPVYQQMQAMKGEAEYMKAVADIAKANASLAQSEQDAAILKYKQSIGYDERVLYNDLLKSGMSVEEAGIALEIKKMEYNMKAYEMAMKDALGGLDPQVLQMLLNTDKLLGELYAADPTAPGTPAFKRIEKTRDLISGLFFEEGSDGGDYTLKMRRLPFGIYTWENRQGIYEPNIEGTTAPAAQKTKSRTLSDMDAELEAETGQ